ncbi:MAG: FKBP-type peptidyl-prolyl cis-trans isomerase [Muribaculaceae bacterium]|nr:FKBP-type peptidyl-prolyl cis-trans isomerase [Muribaculaceae bacterium]
MKKLIIGACGVAVLALASCGNCSDTSCSSSTSDSLSNAYGEYVGSVLGNDYQRMDDGNKKEFMRGMQIVFGANEDRNTQMGMQVAIQMMGEIKQLENEGVVVDRAKAMNAFKKAFMADSIDMETVQKAAQEFQGLMTKAREEATAAKEAEKAAAPDAVENVKLGNEYVAEIKAKDSSVKTTESGLSYKIDAEGEAAKPTANSTVVVNYTGRHLNGDVFDSTDGRGPATFNLQGVVPGFREGLMLIGKGGKATLYIPGELAYGPNGQPSANIGPNEMLVFDVELLEVNPE